MILINEKMIPRTSEVSQWALRQRSDGSVEVSANGTPMLTPRGALYVEILEYLGKHFEMDIQSQHDTAMNAMSQLP